MRHITHVVKSKYVILPSKYFTIQIPFHGYFDLTAYQSLEAARLLTNC